MDVGGVLGVLGNLSAGLDLNFRFVRVALSRQNVQAAILNAFGYYFTEMHLGTHKNNKSSYFSSRKACQEPIPTSFTSHA